MPALWILMHVASSSTFHLVQSLYAPLFIVLHLLFSLNFGPKDARLVPAAPAGKHLVYERIKTFVAYRRGLHFLISSNHFAYLDFILLAFACFWFRSHVPYSQRVFNHSCIMICTLLYVHCSNHPPIILSLYFDLFVSSLVIAKCCC